MYLYEMCDEKLRTNNERRTTTVVNVNQFVKNNGPCFNLFILSIICVVDDGILYFLRRRGVCCVCVPVVGLAFSWPPSLFAHGGVIVLLSPPDHIVSSVPGKNWWNMTDDSIQHPSKSVCGL